MCILEGHGGIIFVCHTFVFIYFFIAVFSTGSQKADSHMTKLHVGKDVGKQI